MGLQCLTTESQNVVVDAVRPGTAAADCGIQKGDRVLDAHVQGDALNVTIARDGAIFRARLRELKIDTSKPLLQAEMPKTDALPKPFNLNAEQKFFMPDNQLIPEMAKVDKSKPLTANSNRFALQANQNFKVLANYNVELIVDRSMSMGAKDCPDGLSRWGWCGQQAADLADSLSSFTPNGMTIIPFASEYDVFEHATAKNVDYMFNNVQLQLGTRLYEPLAERLDTYFAHYRPGTKPLLIVIVTDGEPAPKIEPQLVKSELIQTSQKMKSAQQVTVIFCQIGKKDRTGIAYLNDLDSNLVNEGAKYHFVHTVSFDELQEAGLGPAVAASINQYAPVPTIAPANQTQKGKATHVPYVPPA
jgi:hypothetical protein